MSKKLDKPSFNRSIRFDNDMHRRLSEMSEKESRSFAATVKFIIRKFFLAIGAK